MQQYIYWILCGPQYIPFSFKLDNKLYIRSRILFSPAISRGTRLTFILIYTKLFFFQMKEKIVAASSTDDDNDDDSLDPNDLDTDNVTPQCLETPSPV